MMSKNTSFSIGEHFSDFIDEQVKEGRYSSASDVVRAGLRLLEEQEAKLAAFARRPHRGRAKRPFHSGSILKRLLHETGRSVFGLMTGR